MSPRIRALFTWVLTVLLAARALAASGEGVVYCRVEVEADDGTEVSESVWDADGYAGSGCNRMGVARGERYAAAMRFCLPQVQQGEKFVCARMVLPGMDDGHVDNMACLRIVGVDQDSVAPFGEVPPSQLPRTVACTTWMLSSNWPVTAGDSNCTPLVRYSPDIAPLINEIVARPGWGKGPDGKTLAIIIEDSGSSRTNYLAFRDYVVDTAGCPGAVVSAGLELYRNVRSTFVGQELLVRPTDNSVTIHALSLVGLEAFADVGTMSGVLDLHTPVVTQPAGTPLRIVMDGLLPDTRYFYRLRYRRPGDPEFEAGPERTFHTQRSRGHAFIFTVVSDMHLELRALDYDADRRALCRRALENALADGPDFHLDLGDTFFCESYSGRDVLDFEEAVKRHLDQRCLFDLLCHSSPLFLVLGNHEGEQGWRLDGTPNNVAVWAANARKVVYPLPVPDGFYTGNSQPEPHVGLRESCYAWEWGDALLVVLDPYWYTTRKPHDMPLNGGPGSGDNWDWTLGSWQYEWLAQTLAGSSATFKFVFSHQLVGGVNTYGRGGVEGARHALGGRGSFEWGGESATGNVDFDRRRPAWGRPVHQLLADNKATIFFHGHDHVFVKQELDGVIYQACPQPSDTTYGQGHYLAGLYLSGDEVNNSGHLRVAVSPTCVTVDYVRAFLPGDGANGVVSYSYTVPAPSNVPSTEDLRTPEP
jgi:hypothetical protein